MRPEEGGNLATRRVAKAKATGSTARQAASAVSAKQAAGAASSRTGRDSKAGRTGSGAKGAAGKSEGLLHPRRSGPRESSRWESQWARQYENLQKFRRKNADRWPGSSEEYPAGNRLGQWCQRQRDLQERGELSKERAGLLKKVGFSWEKADDRETHWMEQYAYLKEYRKKNPGKWPFAREEFPKGNRLGLWVWRQRQNFARGTLEGDRQGLLEKVNFPLELPDSWTTHLENLAQYRQRHPDRWPKAREEFPKGNRLGLWCHLQRCANKAGKLAPDRVKDLTRLGFLWSVKDFNWERNFNLLKEYKKKVGKKWPVVESTSPAGKRLAYWCSTQRLKRKIGKLDEEKIDRLDRLGFRWES